jgi:hypothetical protein
MKKSVVLVFLLAAIVVTGYTQNPVNWEGKQLIEPAELAKTLSTGKDVPVIISIGPGVIIPYSIDVGMVNSEAGLKKLNQKLANIPRREKVVIYCGCCPFEHCPKC